MGREVMAMGYGTFFGFTKEPFQADLKLDEILQTPELMGVKERFDYAIGIGAMALVTGEIGSGKSTALRYAVGQLHPSEYATFYVTAASGSILELYRQILGELGMDSSGTSRTRMTQQIQREIRELVLGSVRPQTVNYLIFRKKCAFSCGQFSFVVVIKKQQRSETTKKERGDH